MMLPTVCPPLSSLCPYFGSDFVAQLISHPASYSPLHKGIRTERMMGGMRGEREREGVMEMVRM